jgi:hypothetical protein
VLHLSTVNTRSFILTQDIGINGALEGISKVRGDHGCHDKVGSQAGDGGNVSKVFARYRGGAD